MRRAVRTSLGLAVGVVLLSAVALAHASSNNTNKSTDSRHQSRISKLAFWRRHKDRDKTGRTTANTHQNTNEQHHSRLSKLVFWRHHRDSDKSAKTAQASHAQPKYAHIKAVQTKPAPRTQAAKKRDQKQVRHAMGQSAAKKGSVPKKVKPQEKTQDHTTASLK
jgi:hypothetical protein